MRIGGKENCHREFVCRRDGMHGSRTAFRLGMPIGSYRFDLLYHPVRSPGWRFFRTYKGLIVGSFGVYLQRWRKKRWPR